MMRLDSNYVRLHIVQELESSPFAKVRYDDFDVIVVDLLDNEAAAVCIMNRETPLHEIIGIYHDHQKYDIHTVFVLWCEMLVPDHELIFEPSEWLQALHTLGNQKIYAYKTVGDEVEIFPVYFEPIGFGPERLVKYGKPIDVKDLGCAFIDVTGSRMKINGKWRMAEFRHGRAAENTERVYQARMEEEYRRQQEAYQEQRRQQSRYRKTAAEQKTTKEILLDEHMLLGVTLGATWNDIKQAYRAKARQYHPDLNPSPVAKEKMQQINAAYAELMAFYDDNPAA